jgi:hypothetical protein
MCKRKYVGTICQRLRDKFVRLVIYDIPIWLLIRVLASLMCCSGETECPRPPVGSRLLSLSLHPTMVDDEDHVPVEFHNSNYGKGTWEIYWVRLLPSRGRSPTMGADIVSRAFPGRPLGFQ